VIVLCGIANVGKSNTIKKAYELLVALPVKIKKEKENDSDR
jgi:hypothetical protein